MYEAKAVRGRSLGYSNDPTHVAHARVSRCSALLVLLIPHKGRLDTLGTFAIDLFDEIQQQGQSITPADGILPSAFPV